MTLTLKFIPYSSAFDTGFWHELTRRKLDIYRLDSSNISIYGYYSNGKNHFLPLISKAFSLYFDRFE